MCLAFDVYSILLNQIQYFQLWSSVTKCQRWDSLFVVLSLNLYIRQAIQVLNILSMVIGRAFGQKLMVLIVAPFEIDKAIDLEAHIFPFFFFFFFFAGIMYSNGGKNWPCNQIQHFNWICTFLEQFLFVIYYVCFVFILHLSLFLFFVFRKKLCFFFFKVQSPFQNIIMNDNIWKFLSTIWLYLSYIFQKLCMSCKCMSCIICIFAA